MNKKIRIGEMTEQCTFLTPTETQDANGAANKTYVEGSAVWCHLDYKTAGSDEKQEGARIHSFQMVLVTLRLDTTITEKMRIKFDGNEHNIISIAPYRRLDRMQIECVQDKPE